MGIEISLSHCISNHLRVRVTAVVFVALHLFHISRFSEVQERKKYVYKDNVPFYVILTWEAHMSTCIRVTREAVWQVVVMMAKDEMLILATY